MTREEWLAAKSKAVSSTESPALFHMSPYITEFELAVQKRDATLAANADNERTTWGRRLQDAIAQGIADDHGIVIEGTEYEFTPHPTMPRMGSSFDYRVVDASPNAPTGGLAALFNQHGPGLLEIKNVDALIYRDWPDVDLPDHIEIQVQHQLEVARVNWAVVGVFVGGNRTELYIRMRDEVVGTAIASRVSKFWHDFDRGVMPNPIMPQDADIIIKLYQYAEPNLVFDGQEDETLADLCAAYQLASFNASQAEKEARSVKAQILQRIGSAERALGKGYNISASMVAPAEVQAYTRAGYRYFKVTKRVQKA